MSFLEAAVLVGNSHQVLYQHAPPGRSVAYLPDDGTFWAYIWRHRDDLLGIAHTHPGAGPPQPSGTDISTFRAIESGLGRNLVWWILSEDTGSAWFWNGDNAYTEVFRFTLGQESIVLTGWITVLQELSGRFS